MLMPKAHRTAIYEYLFTEGVLVAKKDFHAQAHPGKGLEKIPNLHVIKTLQSLKSRGYVKEQFAWRHYYWYLTNEGIAYLRDYLHLPDEIVPATLKRQARSEPSRGDRGGRGGRGDQGDRDGAKPSDRAEYRRGGERGGEDGGAPTEFRGGFGRGRPAQQPQQAAA